MAIGAPEPRTGSAYWASGAAGLGAAAEVARIFTPAQALTGLKALAIEPRDTLEVGSPQARTGVTYDAKGTLGKRPGAGEERPAPAAGTQASQRPAEAVPAKADRTPPPAQVRRPAASGGKDANGDGVISPAERLAYLASHPALDPRDRNLDGTVSPAEAQAAAGARPATGSRLDTTA